MKSISISFSITTVLSTSQNKASEIISSNTYLFNIKFEIYLNFEIKLENFYEVNLTYLCSFSLKSFTLHSLTVLSIIHTNCKNNVSLITFNFLWQKWNVDSLLFFQGITSLQSYGQQRWDLNRKRNWGNGMLKLLYRQKGWETFFLSSSSQIFIESTIFITSCFCLRAAVVFPKQSWNNKHCIEVCGYPLYKKSWLKLNTDNRSVLSSN